MYMIEKLKGLLRGFQKKPDTAEKSIDSLDSYQTILVERVLLENVIASIDKAYSNKILNSNQTKTLRTKYNSRLRVLSTTLEKNLLNSQIQNLERIRQHLKEEYELKIQNIDKQIAELNTVSHDNSLRSISQTKVSQLDLTPKKKVKILREELLSAIARLEKIDQE